MYRLLGVLFHCQTDLIFNVTFGNEIVSLLFKSKIVGTGILIDDLYKLNLHSSYFESLYVNNLGTKRILIKKTPTVFDIGVQDASQKRESKSLCLVELQVLQITLTQEDAQIV